MLNSFSMKYFQMMVQCSNKNNLAAEIIWVASMKLFQSNQTCRELCKCHLLSAHAQARDSQLAPPIPWKNFILFQDGTTCWIQIISAKNYFTVKYYISRWNYINSTRNHWLRPCYKDMNTYIILCVNLS